MFTIVQKPDGFYIVDQGGNVVNKKPFPSREMAQQAADTLSKSGPVRPPSPADMMGVGAPPGGPPMGMPGMPGGGGVPPMMGGQAGPGGPGGAPPLPMLLAMLAKAKKG